MDRASEHATWFVVGALVGAVGAALWHRLGGPPLVAGTDAAAPTGLTGPKNPRLAAAGRKGVAAARLNSQRYRCAECDHTTTAGPMGCHHKSTGHTGRIKADD